MARHYEAVSAPVDVVRVEGPDAATYLQGQLSQDVEAMAAGAEAWAFLLEPNGHIEALLKVTRTGDAAFDLAVDAGAGDAVEQRLRRFLLRTKAEVTLHASDRTASASDHAERIRAGRPAVGAEVDGRAVPAETGWVDRAVSFTKGCYTGQELVARMDSRAAAPPRRLVHLRSDAVLEAGATIVVEGADAGVVTSAAAVENGSIALGYLKRGQPVTGVAMVGGAAVTLEGPVGG